MCCRAMNRLRIDESYPWRQVLGHLRLEPPRLTMQLEGHTGAVTSVAQLADGRIISGSRDKSLRVWNLESGSYITEMCGHTSAVT